MTAPTAPTVVQPPAGPAAAPAAPAGPLASILAPVQPARPVAPIGSTAKLAEESAGSTTGTKKSEKNTSTSGGPQDGPFGALVRALATRLHRSGTASKMTRTHAITETRASGNMVNSQNRSNRDAKASHQNHRDAKLADLNNKSGQAHARSNREAKSSNANASQRHQTARDGLDVKDSRGAKTTGATAAKGATAPAKQGDVPANCSPDGRLTKAPGPSAAKPNDVPKPDTAPGDKAIPDSRRREEKPPVKAATPYGATDLRTKPSREAGYRDGQRGGAVVGHVKAYRDGVQDGYGDRSTADEAEKRRMDDAKAQIARQAAASAAPKMTPASGSTVDLLKKEPAAPAAVPVQLTGISDKAVQFTAAGVSHTMSRGEVRTLKAFERRMEAKARTLAKVAEDAKASSKRARQQASRAQRLAEDARSVDGGANLVGKLVRLAERAKDLDTKAESIAKAAVRGAEAMRVLVANANTRHGPIYRAVVDSPLTKPAEREFYQDTEGS